MKTLRELFDKHGCDKGSKKHKYDRCYELYMEDKREDSINLLEIGCFRGESIRAWFDCFPNANIYTIDIFERVDTSKIDILQEDRVHWLKADSMNASLPSRMRKKWGEVEFDFIVDDGAHFPEANRLTFNHCFPFLKRDGSYFIEDVWMLDRMKKTHDWVAKRPQLYNMPDHVRFMTTVEEHDVKHYNYTSTVHNNPEGFKKTFPDGYILRVRHAE